MKKRLNIVLISMIMVSLFTNGKAHAAERVVMNGLPSESWEENVYLLANKTDWTDYRNFDVQIGNEGALYHFPKWKSGRYGTRMYNEDLNGDRHQEIIIVLDNYDDPVHILQYGKVDTIEDYKEVSIETAEDAVKRLVKMEKSDDIVTISTKQRTYKVNIKSLGYSDTSPDTKIYPHKDVEYFVDKKELIGDTVVMISTNGGSAIGNFKLTYGWGGKKYEVQSISFEKYDIPQNN